MLRFAPFVALLTHLPVLAQDSLAELEQRFRAEVQRLAEAAPSREQREQLLQRHAAELRTFVKDKARGDDRWNGRLLLADLELARGDRGGAKAALEGIEVEQAPALVLATAATMAQPLGMQDLRDRLVDAAARRDAKLDDRLAVARLLTTVLHEIERGEKLFDELLAAASDDEQRAYVRFHRADAMRDREDLPDNAGFEELQKLAEQLPKTYWGSVAKDRLRATELSIGDPAIDFRGTTLGGDELRLSSLRGKAVVLAFWSYADFDTPVLVDTLKKLQKQHGEALTVVGIALDREKPLIEAAVKQLGIGFPVIGAGEGVRGDAALRWLAEGPVVHVVDKQGNVAGLGLQAGTADGRAQLDEAVQRAVGG